MTANFTILASRVRADVRRALLDLDRRIKAVPTGTIEMFGAATAPEGYLLCAGGTASRVGEAALFAVLGTTWGVGDGSTTFGLPDLRDRLPIGAGSTYSLADTGGSKDAIAVSHGHANTFATGNQSASHTHTATVGNQTASHFHSVNVDHNHGSFNVGPSVTGGKLYDMEAIAVAGGFPTSGNPGYLWGNTAGVGRLQNNSALWDNGDLTVAVDVPNYDVALANTTGQSSSHSHTVTNNNQSASHSHTVTGSVTDAGASGINANLPPYAALSYIIKT